MRRAPRRRRSSARESARLRPRFSRVRLSDVRGRVAAGCSSCLRARPPPRAPRQRRRARHRRGDIEHVLSGRCGVQLPDGFVEAPPEALGSTAPGTRLQLIRRPGVGGAMGWPVKARGVHGPADARLFACGLGENGQAGAEAVIGGRHAVRLKRITPAVECVPEVAERPLLVPGAACCAHLVIVAGAGDDQAPAGQAQRGLLAAEDPSGRLSGYRNFPARATHLWAPGEHSLGTRAQNDLSKLSHRSREKPITKRDAGGGVWLRHIGDSCVRT
jgi:hypothetical protein